LPREKIATVSPTYTARIARPVTTHVIEADLRGHMLIRIDNPREKTTDQGMREEVAAFRMKYY
jgi:hypothetical protein